MTLSPLEPTASPPARPLPSRDALSRRHALLTGVTALAAPMVLGAGFARPAQAAAGQLGPAIAPWQRFRIGGFEVTTLLAGSRATEKPQETFGTNVSAEEFAATSAANFLPVDKAQNYFTPTLVNTGKELVLFDAGLSAEGTLAAMTAAGVAPDQVDVVVLTHMHGDHIGGLMQADGTTPTYPNARYVTGAVENNHWAAAGNEGYDKNVRPLTEKTTYLDDGGAVAPGITAMAAFGHSPGHMAYLLDSDGARLAITADTANHYVWSLQYPDWEVRFDADKAAAAATRKQVFGMIAADRIPFVGYHMPFPGVGYAEPKDAGFRFVPVSYQLML